MLSRIKIVIDSQNLSPSRFADYIGVPRATISHILSGRNKASLEVVQKILEAFPRISADWLVLGKGSQANKPHDLFTEVENATRENEQLLKHKGIEEPELPDTVQPDTKSVHEGKGEEVFKKDVVTQVASQAKQVLNNDKQSVKVIVLYADGSYAEYFPEK